AFSVGLFANAILPGRIGELARVAVLTRKLPGRRGAWATLVGTVFAHRVFDVVAGDARRGDRARRRPLRLRVRDRAAAAAAPARRARPGAPPVADGPCWARGHALADGRRRRDRLPALRLALPAPRRLHGDARVRHPLAPPGGGRRPARDERRHDPPLLARP